MLVRSVFWAALAAMYVVLAIVTFRGRKHVKGHEHPFAADLPTSDLLPTSVSTELTKILTAEIAGFVLAAVAALFEALT